MILLFVILTICGVSYTFGDAKSFKSLYSWFSWFRKCRAPIPNKIVVRRISEIPTCANHTGLWFYLPVYSHTTNECALKQNLRLTRFFIVSGSGVVGGYLCGPNPLAVVGAFAGGAAGGFFYDCAVTVVLTHCADNEIVLFGHFERLYVVFCEDATQNEYVRQILCLIFCIILDGFAGIVGYNAIQLVHSQLKPTAPKIDLKALKASKTKKYKQFERLLEQNVLSKKEKYAVVKKVHKLRSELHAMIGDGDKGHKKRIDDYVVYLSKNVTDSATC